MKFLGVKLSKVLTIAFLFLTVSHASLTHAKNSCPEELEKLRSFTGLIPETANVRGLFVSPKGDYKAYAELASLDPKLTPIFNPKRSMLETHMGLRSFSDIPMIYGDRLAITWTRDYLPELVRTSHGKFYLAHFRYDASGDFADFAFSYLINSYASAFNLPVVDSSLILQGGNIMVDEEGHLFTTSKVMTENKNRRSDVESELKKVLLVKSVHIIDPLPDTYEGTGHIDMMAKFVGNNTVIVASSKVRELKEPLDRTARFFGRRGYRIIRIPNAQAEPADVRNRWVRSYTNSTLVNGTVYMPTYDDPKFDIKAKKIYEDLGFQVKEISASDLICDGGSVHCALRQLHILPTK